MYQLIAIIQIQLIFYQSFRANYNNWMSFQKVLTEQSTLSTQILASTNDVIMYAHGDKQVTYYIPCYVRFAVKQIQDVDVSGLQGTIAGTLYVSFYYGKIDYKIIQQFIGDGQKAIELQFNQEDSIQLRETKGITLKTDQKNQIVEFIVRQNFRTNLEGEVFWTPFQTLDLYLAITIEDIHLNHKTNNGRKIRIKFNCMDSNEATTLGHEQTLSFGQYRLACALMDAKYTNKRKNPFKVVKAVDQLQEEFDQHLKHLKEKDQEYGNIDCFQYVHFNVPVYKYPGNSIFTIFIPLWILGFIGILVFFQEPAFSMRLSTISVLALAYVAFIPTINDSIPQTPNLKMVDIFIMMELTATVLLLIQSYQVRNNLTSEDFVCFDSSFFIGNLVLNIVPIIILAILFILHKACWEGKYIQQKPKSKKKAKFNRFQWKNRDCDEFFQKLIKSPKVRIL